jgi:hypothetical protein
MLAHRAADVPVLDILPHELQRVLRRGLRCSTGTHGLLHDGYHLVLTEVGRERLLRIVPRCSGLWHFAGDEAPGDKRHRVVGARLPCKSHAELTNDLVSAAGPAVEAAATTATERTGGAQCLAEVRRDLFVDEVQDLFVLAAASASMRAPRLTCAGPVLNDDPHDKNVLMRADPHPAFQREQTAARSKICRQRTPCPSSRMLWQLLVRNSLKPWRGSSQVLDRGPRERQPRDDAAAVLSASSPCSQPRRPRRLLLPPSTEPPTRAALDALPVHRPQPTLQRHQTPTGGRSTQSPSVRPALAASQAHKS